MTYDLRPMTYRRQQHRLPGDPMSARKATIKRKTKETDITLTLDLDGSGRVEAATGIGFLLLAPISEPPSPAAPKTK